MSDVVARVLQSLDPDLRRSGTSLDELLRDYHLSPELVWARPGNRIAWDSFAGILESAGDRLGGNQALENIGASRLVESWQALVALVCRYATPVGAFTLGVKWVGPLLFRGIRGDVIEIPGGIIETVVIPPDRCDSPEFFALCRGAMRETVLIMGWEIVESEFSHFDRRGTYRMTFRRAGRRLLEDFGDRKFEWIERDLEEIACLTETSDSPSRRNSAGADASVSIVDQVRSLYHCDNHRPPASFADTARALAMSERSLARRLADEGTTFRAVRDDLRVSLAIERIRRGDSISEMAFDLGFADTTSFHRAFHRWTGRSPGSYKAAHRAGRMGDRV